MHHRIKYDETMISSHRMKCNEIRASQNCLYCNDTRMMQNHMTYDEIRKLSPHKKTMPQQQGKEARVQCHDTKTRWDGANDDNATWSEMN